MIYFIFNDEKLTLNKEKFNVSHAFPHSPLLSSTSRKRGVTRQDYLRTSALSKE